MFLLPPIFLLTDRHLSQNLRAKAVIVRDYDHPARVAYARSIVAGRKGHPVLIAGDIALARAVGGQGAHIPEWQLKTLPHRLFHPKNWLFTAACHSLPALIRAQKHPLIDAALVSPLFPTLSHPEAKAMGVVRFGLLMRQIRLPAYGLGGLRPQDLGRVRQFGGVGIALRSNWLA